MWETEILNKYPKTFASLKYFECDKGWYSIIDRVANFIEEYNNKIDNVEDHVVATQVKQKFGGLRFYISYITNASEQDIQAIYDVINQAEKDSFTMCEVCGKPAKATRWSTLCDEHSH